jgi:hypothetical protein
MVRTKQTSKWIVDLALLVAFLVEFYMDLTGVALHQWMGVTLAAAILYHLVTHWTWVKLVTARFFTQTSSRARLYYLLDGGLLAGFGAIIATGLVISTWLDLPLSNYATWYDVHVFSSIATLALLVGKLAAHWRWIVQNSLAIFGRGKPAGRLAAPAGPAVPAVQPINAISRRHFLAMMGGLTLASMVSIGTALNGASGASAVQATTGTATSSPAAGSGSTGSTTTLSTGQPAASATSVPSRPTSTTTSAPTATQAATSTTASVATACTIRCNKKCAYPGRCRKYTDSNGNGRCDLGECA